MKSNTNNDWSDGLSVCTANRLRNIGVNSREQALDLFLNRLPHKRFRNFGPSSIRQVAVWLGLRDADVVNKEPKTHCPFCGNRIA